MLQCAAKTPYEMCHTRAHTILYCFGKSLPRLAYWHMSAVLPVPGEPTCNSSDRTAVQTARETVLLLCSNSGKVSPHMGTLQRMVASASLARVILEMLRVRKEMRCSQEMELTLMCSGDASTAHKS